jgi:ankyrin repeat protein
MNGRKQLRIGCLLFCLLIVVLPGFLIWLELRQERLSGQLLTTLKDVQSISEINYDPEDGKDVRQRESLKKQIRLDEAKAVRLIQEGADPNVRDFPMVKRTLWEEVKFLLKRTFRRPSAATSLPHSALAIAVQGEDAVIVNALLNAGANDVNAEIETDGDALKFPLVNYGAYTGNLEIVRGLSAHGADLHKISRNYIPEGETILHSVLEGSNLYRSYRHKVTDVSDDLDRKRRIEIFHLLLAKGVHYEPNSKEGYELLCAATGRDLAELTRDMLAAGVPPNPQPKWLDTPPEYPPLDSAVASDDIAAVKLLLQYGARIRDEHEEAPILYVKSLKMAKLLLGLGADIHAVQNWGKRSGENALNFACIDGNTEVALFLLEHGLNVNSGGEFSSPIDQAAEYGGFQTVRLLLQHGAKVGPGSPGADALWLAIAEQHFDSAKLLLQYGAAVNPRLATPRSDTEYPLAEAARQDNADMALDLLKHGADVNAGNGEALLEACESCDEDLVEMLLEHGANPNIQSQDGTTAIQAARESADPPEDADGIVALLKRYGAKK